MGSSTDERFPKSLRIRKRSEYLAVQQDGTRVPAGSFLGIFTKRSDNSPARLGITVTKKTGCAVFRNKVKRLVKEAFRRRILHVPEGLDLVVIARKSSAQANSSRMYNDLAKLSRKLSRMSGDRSC